MFDRRVGHDEAKAPGVPSERPDHLSAGRGQHDPVRTAEDDLALVDQLLHRSAERIEILVADPQIARQFPGLARAVPAVRQMVKNAA